MTAQNESLRQTLFLPSFWIQEFQISNCWSSCVMTGRYKKNTDSHRSARILALCALLCAFSQRTSVFYIDTSKPSSELSSFLFSFLILALVNLVKNIGDTAIGPNVILHNIAKNVTFLVEYWPKWELKPLILHLGWHFETKKSWSNIMLVQIIICIYILFYAFEFYSK